jgi:hypothetical protein
MVPPHLMSKTRRSRTKANSRPARRKHLTQVHLFVELHADGGPARPDDLARDFLPGSKLQRTEVPASCGTVVLGHDATGRNIAECGTDPATPH